MACVRHVEMSDRQSLATNDRGVATLCSKAPVHVDERRMAMGTCIYGNFYYSLLDQPKAQMSTMYSRWFLVIMYSHWFLVME